MGDGGTRPNVPEHGRRVNVARPTRAAGPSWSTAGQATGCGLAGPEHLFERIDQGTWCKAGRVLPVALLPPLLPRPFPSPFPALTTLGVGIESPLVLGSSPHSAHQRDPWRKWYREG